jgi:hypothetical protein
MGCTDVNLVVLAQNMAKSGRFSVNLRLLAWNMVSPICTWFYRLALTPNLNSVMILNQYVNSRSIAVIRQ